MLLPADQFTFLLQCSRLLPSVTFYILSIPCLSHAHPPPYTCKCKFSSQYLRKKNKFQFLLLFKSVSTCLFQKYFHHAFFVTSTDKQPQVGAILWPLCRLAALWRDAEIIVLSATGVWQAAWDILRDKGGAMMGDGHIDSQLFCPH